MKLKYVSVAALAAISMLLSSCAFSPGDSYGTFSYATNGYDSSVSWTSASYDANGFPIFGYSYGRPVYGYTQSGSAIFTIAALTALSYVPKWKPAPWYCGHWHYPAQVRYVPAPPRFPAGHRPGVRPPGGMNAAIHRNPGAILKPRPAVAHKPASPKLPGAVNRPLAPRPMADNNRPGGNKPGNLQRPGSRPGMAAKPAGKRPEAGDKRPGGTRPAMNGRPGRGENFASNRPGGQRPAAADKRSDGNNRPAMGQRPGSRPGMAANNRAAQHPAAGNKRPAAQADKRPGRGNNVAFNRPGGAPARNASGSR